MCANVVVVVEKGVLTLVYPVANGKVLTASVLGGWVDFTGC